MLLIVIDVRFFNFVFSFIFNHHLFFLPTVTRNQRNIRNNVKKTCFALFALGVVVVFVVSTCCRANSTSSSPYRNPRAPLPFATALEVQKTAEHKIKKKLKQKQKPKQKPFICFVY